MQDRSGQVLAVAVPFFILAWLSVSLRVYVRTRMIKAFGIDDITMLITLAFFTIYMVCQLGGVAHGTGQHRSAITDENAQIALRYWFFCELFYTLSTSTLKISIGFFLLRITVSRNHIWIIRSIMIASAVVGVVYCFIVLFQCQPTSYWWDLAPDAKGKCLTPSLEANTLYVVSALNSLADWVFGILPLFIVKDLQMKTSSKVVVVSIVGFAAIGSAATIIRMPYLWTMKGYKRDFLWRTTDVALWTTVEVGIGITAGCMATLKPLMKSLMHAIGAQSSSSPGSKSTKRTGPKIQGYSRYGELQPLDVIKPTNNKSCTTTTVTGRRLSKTQKGISSWVDHTRTGDSEENILPEIFTTDEGHLGMAGWKGGINKSVEVTTTEERAPASQKDFGSEGGDEERSLSNKSAVVFERV